MKKVESYTWITYTKHYISITRTYIFQSTGLKSLSCSLWNFSLFRVHEEKDIRSLLWLYHLIRWISERFGWTFMLRAWQPKMNCEFYLMKKLKTYRSNGRSSKLPYANRKQKYCHAITLYKDTWYTCSKHGVKSPKKYRSRRTNIM